MQKTAQYRFDTQQWYAGSIVSQTANSLKTVLFEDM
jgi:hypothetical protein